MKWKNLKLGRKFFVSFGVVITLLALIALIAINGINNLIDGTDSIVERNTIQSDLEHKYVQHLQWAQEVNKLLTDENTTELNVQTDHTKCAFGKWYYGEGRKDVEAKLPELKSLFAEFEEPHKHLHESAIEIKESFVQSDFKVGAKIREIKSDHLLWMHSIKDVLLSKGSKLDVQTDHHKCNMGKWLSSSEIIELRKKDFEFNALVAQVEEPHELLHESAIRIGNYVNARNYNEANNYFYANTNEYAHETLDKLNEILAWQDANMEGMNNANEIYNNKTLKHLKDVGDLFTEVIGTSKSMVSEINKTIVQKAFSTRTGVVIFSLVAIIIAIIFAIIITKGIVVPIRKSMQFAEEVSKGDLTTIIDIDQNDEVGQLSYALQVMIEKLKQIVESVKEGADNIASASQQMNSSSQQMSQGASEQASSAEEVSSSMEEMASNIQQNTDNAQQTEKIALVSANGIKVGSESTEISVKAMKEIAEKITIVNDIAFQTNILALNAAVEAARAGEYGKGFAVVAAEVRKLAERSKIAADEIEHLSKNGVGISEKAGEQLREIMPEIEKTAKLVQEIAAASLEQNSGADQVNSAIQQLNQVTQQNAATSEEMATSSEELASQAEQLMEIISFFKTDTKSIKKNIAPIKNQNVIIKQEDYQKSRGIDINLFEDKVSDVNYEKF